MRATWAPTLARLGSVMAAGADWAKERANGAVASGRDVRQALARSETTLRQTLELTDTGSWDWEIATNTVRWSENLGPIHGLPPGTQPADYGEFLELIHPEDREKIAAAVDRALGEAHGYEIELRTSPRDGNVRWVLAQANVLTDADGTPLRIVGLTRDITRRKLREEHASFLADASPFLTYVAGRGPALDEVARLAVERIADSCAIDVTPDVGVASARARREADGSIVSVSADATPKAEPHDGSTRSAPLVAGDRKLGTVVLRAGEGRPRHEPEDTALLEELASRIGLAIESTRLARLADEARSAAEGAADRARRLQEVTAGLSAAATTTEIADVIVNQGIPALAARTGVLGVLEEPDELHFLRTVGYDDVFPERLKLDEPWPIATAVRERRVVELKDVPERREAFAVPERVWAASGKGTLVAVPLLTREGAIGALGFTREESAPLTDDERQLVETLARQAAHALERAALYEADVRARQQAEGLQRVASAVATAATMEEVAAAVASEAQAVLGSHGVTVVLTPSANAEFADVIASYGPVAPYAESEPRVNLTAETVTAAAIREQTAFFIESPDELQRRWPRSAAVADELGVAGIACIPLRVGERVGALSVVVDVSRRFLPEERRFLDLLARTCEQGLLRAALYEAERAARLRSDVLHGLAAALSGAVTPSDVGDAYLEHALQHLGAGSAALALFDPARSTLDVISLGGTGTTRSQWISAVPADEDGVIAAAYREGRAVTARSREELESRFPRSAERFTPDGRAAYAGPLVFGGRAIGAFGLVFESERAVSAEDARLLATMAELCTQAMERARLYESEHRIAQQLQDALLPERVVDRPDVQVAAFYRAGTEAMVIGGDWYDTFALPDGRLGVAVGDVVGQGIEAAAAMGRLRSALAAYALDAYGPADVMTRLNRFAGSAGGVEFATVCYAVLERESGEFAYSSAGHPPLLVVNGRGETRWLEAGGSQALYGSSAFVAREAKDRLEPGSLLLLYSDGLVERRGEHIACGLERLEEASTRLRDLPPHELCPKLVDALVPSEQLDDVVVVAVRLTPVLEARFHAVFPARPDELRKVRAAARSWLAGARVPQSDIHDIVLALSEACSNAVEHAYRKGAGDVEVEIERADEGVVLSVCDQGSWRAERNDPDRGRGYDIIRALGDRVDVDTGPRGTQVRIVFSVAGGGHA